MELKHTATRSGPLSSFLREEMNMSAGLMNRLKWHSRICVNGQPEFTNFPVKAGDVITVALDDAEPPYPAEDGDLQILYEDDHLLAVDKPAGILVHPSRSRNTGTLANFVAGYYRRTEQPCAFHPVTRLDRDTFGVVLLAKNAHVHAAMNALHTDGKIEKTYRALVYGCPSQQEGVIDAPIARKPLPSLLREIRKDGKPSVTQYAVLETYEHYALLSLRPITGRTHQLRLHCSYTGFPILGDPQYGSSGSQAFSQAHKLTSQLLCAYSLAFPHPITGLPLYIQTRMDVKCNFANSQQF